MSAELNICVGRLPKHVRLTREQECAAIDRIHHFRDHGTEEQYIRARNAFAIQNMRLAMTLVRKLYRGRYSESDMAQDALFGVITAIDRFDTSKGVKFSTYATHWIRHAITRASETQERVVRVPTHVRSTFCAMAKAYQSTNGAITVEEIAAKIGKTVEQCTWVMNAMGASMFDIDDHDAEDEPIDVIEALAMKAQLAKLPKVMRKLDAREKLVIRWRFGMDVDELTLSEIGERLHISRERVRQIQNEALKKMRKAMVTR